jgi:hypothetical protein
VGTSLELYIPTVDVLILPGTACVMESALSTTLIIEGLSFGRVDTAAGPRELHVWGGDVRLENCLITVDHPQTPLRLIAPNACVLVGTIAEGSSPPIKLPTEPSMLLEAGAVANGCLLVNATVQALGAGELRISSGSVLVNSTIEAAHGSVQIDDCGIVAEHMPLLELAEQARAKLSSTNLLVNSSVATVRGSASLTCQDFTITSSATSNSNPLFAASGPGSSFKLLSPATFGEEEGTLYLASLRHGAQGGLLSLETPSAYLGHAYSLQENTASQFVEEDFPGTQSQIVKTSGVGTRLVTGYGYTL